jgi:hypothetical protein
MDQRQVIKYVVDVLDTQRIEYMLVGSYASGAYGEARQTFDLDIVLRLEDHQLDALAAAFPPPDFYLNMPAMRDAVKKNDQFNLIHFASGFKVDFMLVRRDAWGTEQLKRRRRYPIFTDKDAYTASLEDVIIGKLWYYDEGASDKHLRDIAGILRLRKDQVDRDYIEHWVNQLGFTSAWNAVLEREQSAN